MPWRTITTDDITTDLTPVEIATLQNLQGANDQLAVKLTDAINEVRDAMEYWDMYKDKVKEAQEAQSEALEQMVDSLNKAREAQDKFLGSQHPEDDPIRNAERNFDRSVAVSRAQVEGTKRIQQAQESSELADAKSPREKEKIRQKFEGLNSLQDKLFETKTTDAKQDEMGELNDAITKDTNQGNYLLQQMATAGKAGDKKTVDESHVELGKVSDQLQLLNEKKDSLGADIAKDQAVSAMNDRAAAAVRVQSDDTVAQAINAQIEENHGIITNKQKAAIDRLKQVYEAVGGNTDLMISALKDAAAHQSQMKEEIQSIRQQLGALASQQRTG